MIKTAMVQEMTQQMEMTDKRLRMGFLVTQIRTMTATAAAIATAQ